MDGENHGKAYEQMDDLGVFPYFWKHPFFGLFMKSAQITTTSHVFFTPRGSLVGEMGPRLFQVF